MNFNVIIKQFFIENEFHKLAQKISVVRNDGVVLYSNVDDFNESLSIGALVGGLWQAAEALNSLVSKDEQIYDFRLGFDTSSQGIYVLPLKLKDKVFYICAIYREVSNPAMLKNKLRNLKDNLNFFLKEEQNIKKEDIRDEYLFQDITDEEMDKLFNLKRI